MARAHYVEKARKDNRVCKKGESYYWWEFRFGGKHYSKTAPVRSQLTQSSFLSTLWAIEDGLPNEMTEDDVQELIIELQDLMEECQSSLDNMPEHLQDTSDSGQILQDRITALEDWISELEGISCDDEEMTPEAIAEYVSNSNPGID